MFYELADKNDLRYAIPRTISPRQFSLGGSARMRLVRGYGSDVWQAVEDRINEPQVFTFEGFIQSDRDYASIKLVLDDLKEAVKYARTIYLTIQDGTPLASLGINQSLPFITYPTGTDGTLLRVSFSFVPKSMNWEVLGE
jgi:hypothetical protein